MLSKKSLCDETVTISKDEFMDICRKIALEAGGKWDVMTHVVSNDQYNFLRAMEKSRYGWFHKHSNSLFFFAGTSILLITIRCLIDTYLMSTKWI